MKTKVTILLSIILFQFSASFSQQSKQEEAQFAVYFGYRSGISYIKSIGLDQKLEFLATFEHTGLGFTVNKMYYKPLSSNEPNLKLILGYGGFIRNSWDYNYTFDYSNPYFDDRYIGFGINAIVSVDYELNKFPMHIGISLRPCLEIGIGHQKHYPDTGYFYITIPTSELKF